MIIYPKLEDILFYEGRFFTVEWYYTEEGHLPAYEYYQNLHDTLRDRLKYMVNYLADSPFGTRLHETMYKIEDRENKIYAFKPGADRFFNFTTEGRKIILTNAYHKHSQKMAKQDLEKLRIAVKYRDDYKRRTKEGTYYEE